MPAVTPWRWLPAGLAALLLTGLLLPALRAFPNGFVDDDGYFYAQVGYNLGQHSQSSFDGLHQTSGYHLLWGLALGGISKAVGFFTASKDLHLAAFFCFGLWICGLAALGAFRSPLARVAGFCLLLFGFSLAETALLSAVVVAILGRLLTSSRPLGARPSDYALLALVPLVRIDALPLALILTWGIGRRDWRTSGRLAAAAVAGAAVHFAWMHAAFGGWFSVSSVLKAATLQGPVSEVAGRIVENVRNNIAASKAQMLRFGVVWILTGLASWRIHSIADPESRRRQWWTLAAVMAFYLPHFFLSRMRSWYFTPVHVALLYVVTRDADGPRDAFLRTVSRGVCLGIVVAYLAGVAYVSLRLREDQRQVAAFMQALARDVPESGRIFMVDGSGYPGFFSGRIVINGDGLMNDDAYAARLRAGRLAGYLQEERVCFVLTNRRAADPIVDIGGLVVRRADAELVSSVATARTPYDFLQLFRLRRQGCAP